MATNPRYRGAGGYAGRVRALQLVRDRVANGEPCALCGQPIDLTAPQFVLVNGRKRRTPWSLECDEVVPVSRGGSPTDPANLQPAHRLCNQRRGNKLLGEDNQKHGIANGATSARW